MDRITTNKTNHSWKTLNQNIRKKNGDRIKKKTKSEEIYTWPLRETLGEAEIEIAFAEIEAMDPKARSKPPKTKSTKRVGTERERERKAKL